MKIVQAPDIVLSTPAKPIKKIDKEILALIAAMKHTLITASDPEGVGLAAPQVGKSLQLFITKPARNSDFTIFINPKITLMESPTQRTDKKGNSRLEGCLSIKDVWGTVKRTAKVEITFMDETGMTQTKVFSGFPATIIQHEKDHLDGILFPKRVLEQNGKLYKSHKDEHGDEVYDLIEL
jgi:peptide deformylase